MKLIFLSIALEWFALNCAPGLDESAALGSPRFKIRQDTARALERRWPATDATLRKTALSSDIEAAEQASAIRRRCLGRALDQAGPAPWADWPLMNSEFNGWDNRRFPWLYERIKRELPAHIDGVPMFSEYQQLSEQWALSALDAGVPPSVIKIWFATGRAVDGKWKAHQAPQYEWDKMP